MKINKINIPVEDSTTGSTTIINNSGGGSGTSSTCESSKEAGKLSESHTIWGKIFNGTQDVSGDINNAANINSIGGDITVKSTTDSDGTYGGNITADGTITGSTVTSTTINSTNGNIVNIKSTDVNTSTVEATTGTITNLSGNSENFKSAIIDILGSTNITTDYLTVTKKAHFFSLVIDEIKSVGGQVILTPANATIDLVETVDGNYRCYFKAKDGEGKQIFNQFVVNDQAICQTFNVSTGTSYDVSNKYYWRLLTGIGTATKTINDKSVECHYIDLSSTDCDTSSDIPESGDKIALLGNRTDSSRQSAIIISAYKSPDSTVEAPSIVQYSGINDYKLSDHKLNQIAKNGNIFKGNFYTSTGSDIENLISSVGQGTTAYLHTAYSDSSSDWSKTYDKEYNYIGFCTNYTKDDTSLVYSDYTWARLKGTIGSTVTIKSNSITYQTSTNGSTIPTGTWLTSIPSVNDGEYLWSKTTVEYTDGTTTVSYGVSRYGKDGTNGTSITIKSTSVTYSITSDGTKPSDSTFTYTSIPTVGTGDYLWSKTTIVYSDNTTTSSYSVSRIGADGSNGTNGTNGTNGKTSYFHIAYSNSSDGKTGFNTTYFDGALYIGTYTDTNLADSPTYSDYTWSRLRGEDGTNGKGIKSVSEYYMVSENKTGIDNTNVNFSETIPTLTPTNKYLWNYELITYSDSTTSKTDAVIIGVYGDSVTIDTTSIMYQSSSDGSTIPTGTWSNIIPTVSVGNYLWTKTTVAYSDGKSTVSYNVSRIGADGTSVTIKNTSVTYSISTTSSQPSDSTFTYTSIPSLSKGDYLWSKTTVTYSDGKSITSYSVSRIGSDGSNGTNGVNSYLHIAYSNSSNGATDFNTTYFDGALYIGTYSDSTKADSQKYTDYSWKRLKGEDGVSISSTTITYQASTSGTTTPTGTWSTTIPSVAGGSYLWTKTVINYSDGKSTTSYTISRQAKDGEGSSVNISNTSVTYATSTTNTQPADSAFTYNSVPSVSVGSYLWSKTVVNFSDSTSIKNYSVSRIGADGTTGTKGDDGKTTYLHIAYSNESDGQNFSTSYFSGALYIGTCTDYNETDPSGDSDYTKYTWSRLKGEDGVTISGSSITYQSSTNGTTAPTGTWLTTIPTVSAGSYLWTRTVVTYSDGKSTTTYNVSRMGTNGSNGSNGTNGTSITIKSTSVNYSVTTTSTQPSDSTFNSTTIPILAAGDYLWSMTVITYSDDTSVKSYSVSRIGSDGKEGTAGTNGTNGDTTYLHIAYANTDQGDDFSRTYFSGALYIGTYTDTTQEDSKYSTSYSWKRLKGEDGKAGKGISTITNYYLASPLYTGVLRSTTGWTTTIQDVTYINKYLWNFEVVGYTDGTETVTDPHIIGTYGSDGANIKGFTIDTINKEYGSSTVKSTQPSTWTSTMPELSSTNKYIWERETTTYKCINEDTRNIVIGTSSDWQSNSTYIQLDTYNGIDLTKTDGTITISFDAKAPDGNSTTNNYNVGLHLKDSTGNRIDDITGGALQEWITDMGHIPTDSTHYVYTINLKNKIVNNGNKLSDVKQFLVMLCYSGIADGSGCYTKNLKITVNTIDTDWEQAPEDLTKSVDPHIIAMYSESTEFYKLVDNASLAAIDVNRNLVLKLNYGIVHVIGTESELMTTTPTEYKIYFSIVDNSGSYGSWTEFTSSLANSGYTYNTTIANSTSKVNVEVNLNDASGNIIDSKVIPVVFLAGAAFSVTDTITANVQSNTGDISTLQETASGLESKVSSFHLGESNLFGFNRGIDFVNTRPCPEFYGLAVSGKSGESCTNYRISNLGFNGTQGVGETYIVTCQIKMQTTARTLNINLCDVTARNGKSIFNATTDWKDFIGIYDNVNDFNYVGNYNGFLDFENDTESLTNWAFIKNLKITKSTIKTDFCIADEDHIVDKASLISDWISNTTDIEADKINNYTVYKSNTNPTSTNTIVNYCYKNDYTIKNNQTYTLSFWAKADKESVISSFFYPSIEVPNVPNFCPMDGCTLSTVTTSWKHYFIYWHTNLDTTATDYLVKNILPIRLDYGDHTNNASAVIEFYGVKFTEGYVTEDNYYESLIKQTASNIELKVKNTGINIDDGTITLDATKTTVKGNLAISQYTDGEGLTVYDSDGIPRIELRTDDMSDVTSMINGSGTSGSLSGYYTWSAQSGMEIHSIETDTYTTATIGTFKVNDTINLSKMVVTFTGVNEYIMYTARLMMNGTIIATLGSGTLYGSANGAQYVNLSDYSYTVTTAGTYNVMLTATVVVLQYTQAYIYSVHPTVYIDGRVKRITTQEIILSKDGLAVNSGVDRWLYISDSEIQLRWMDQGIRLTNNRIYQLYANASGTTSWGAFGSKKHFVNVTSTTYTLETEYDFVILNGTTSTLIVGTDQCYDGRYIRVKDMCSGNAYINFKGTPVLYCDDTSRITDTNKNIELAGNHLRDYTYSLDIGAWIEGYLS